MPMYISTKDVGLSPEFRNKLATLGISSLEDLLTMLVDEVTKPTDKEVISASTLPAEARSFGLGGGSSQAAILPDKTFSYVANGEFFSYDISNITNSLPDGISYLSANVVLTGKGRAASRAASGSIAIPEGADQASVKINLATEFGNLVLNKTFPIKSNSEGSVVLTVDDQSQAPTSMTISENLTALNAAVASLQARK